MVTHNSLERGSYCTYNNMTKLRNMNQPEMLKKIFCWIWFRNFEHYWGDKYVVVQILGWKTALITDSTYGSRQISTRIFWWED